MAYERHAGWTGYYLDNIKAELTTTKSLADAKLKQYATISGIKRLTINQFKMTLNMNKLCTYQKNLNDTFQIDMVLESTISKDLTFTYLKHLNELKLLVLRSKRASLTAKKKPAHGQRRWHNARSVRYCNLFLYNYAKVYENELLQQTEEEVLKYSKSWEMREKSKIRKNKIKKKKFKKFTKFGERRLAKRKKKSVWD